MTCQSFFVDVSICMNHDVRKPVFGFPTRSDINRAVQSKTKPSSLKFWMQVEEELYNQCIENKDADQLRSYCEADLRLCFRIGKNTVFS